MKMQRGDAEDAEEDGEEELRKDREDAKGAKTEIEFVFCFVIFASLRTLREFLFGIGKESRRWSGRLLIELLSKGVPQRDARITVKRDGGVEPPYRNRLRCC